MTEISTAMDSNFPTKAQLWNGAMLATIAHAIFTASHPELSHELSWDGLNYNRQNSQGSRGTITFANDGRVVGVFFDKDSPRNPFPLSSVTSDYDLNFFFRGIPQDLWQLANEEALQYVLDEYKGKTAPVITAAFWAGPAQHLEAAESWNDVLANGASLIAAELMQTETAMAHWQAECEFSARQLLLLKSLHTKKMSAPDSSIRLESWEAAILLASKNVEGISESRSLLKAINIIFE